MKSLQLLSQLMQLAGQAEDLQSRSNTAPMQQQLLQEELTSRRGENSLLPVKLQHAQEGAALGGEDMRSQILSRNLHAGADLAQMGSLSGMQPEVIREILASKLGLGNYSMDQAARDYASRSMPQVTGLLDKLANNKKQN